MAFLNDYSYLNKTGQKQEAYAYAKKSINILLSRLRGRDNESLPFDLDELLNLIHKDFLDDKIFYFLRSRDYVELGILLELNDSYEKAIDFYNKAIEKNRYSWRAYNNKGLSCWKLGRYGDAISSFDKAIEISNRQAEPWINKSFLLIEIIQVEEAKLSEQEVERFLEKKRELAEEALKCIDRAIKTNESMPVAYVNKGCALSMLSDYKRRRNLNDEGDRLRQEEIQCYEKAIELDEEFTLAWYNAACHYSIVGNVDRAIDCLKRSVDINSDMKASAKADPDLQHISDDPRFKVLID